MDWSKTVSVCTSRCVAVTDVIRSIVTFSTNQMAPDNIELDNIPDVTYNYREYQEPLVGFLTLNDMYYLIILLKRLYILIMISITLMLI